MTDRTWHQGPPPHVGWFEASIFRAPGVWRFWDGERWSFGALEHFDEIAAAELARNAFDPGNYNGVCTIEWTHYWPANARVPRTAP